MTAFKVMTWNLENLFAPESEADSEAQKTYQEKLKNLASVISQLNPDVLGVQEVGNPQALSDLATELDGNYPHIELANFPDRRGIRVGFLSKWSVEAREDLIDFPEQGLDSVPDWDEEGNLTNVTRLSRGALRIQVSPVAGQSIDLIVAHLKSKLLSFPSPTGRSRFTPKDENERARVAGISLLKRTAEAVALRVKANELLEGNSRNALIMLGDFNDVPEAATTQILYGPGGSQIKTPGFSHPDKGDEARLFNLAPQIAEARRFSRIYQGKGELIDHILVSLELLPGSPRRLPEVDSHVDALGALPSVGDEPGRRSKEPISDHAPVTALFEL